MCVFEAISKSFSSARLISDAPAPPAYLLLGWENHMKRKAETVELKQTKVIQIVRVCVWCSKFHYCTLYLLMLEILAIPRRFVRFFSPRFAACSHLFRIALPPAARQVTPAQSSPHCLECRCQIEPWTIGCVRAVEDSLQTAPFFCRQAVCCKRFKLRGIRI